MITKRTQKAIEILKAGGFFRRALETQYRGGEKFAYRLRAADGSVVKGIGFQTWAELEPQLRTRECPLSTTYPTEWVL